jgi:hypothetical protein
MLFASRVSGLRVGIRNAVVQKIADENGNLQTLIVRPDLTAEFHARALTETQRVIADRMFKAINPDYPYGAVPYPVGDAMGQEFSTEDVIPGSRYVGYDPKWNIGKFDTRTDLDYDAQGCVTEADRVELKKFTEERLLAVAAQFKELVRLDESLPKPWPSYPMETGPGIAQRILAQASDFGIPFVEVIEFEKSMDKPRKGVISMLEAELVKAEDAKAEDASLGAVIPS